MTIDTVNAYSLDHIPFEDNRNGNLSYRNLKEKKKIRRSVSVEKPEDGYYASREIFVFHY
jgi:hypothetical protein